MPPMSLRTLSSEAYSAGFGLHAFNGHGAGTAGQRIRQASKAPALSSDADGSGSPRPQLKNRPPLLPLAASPGIPKTAQDGAKLKFDANNKKPIKIELMTYFDGTMKRGCNDKGQDPKKNDDIRAPHPSTKEKINDAVVPSMPASIKQQSKVDASSKKVSQASAGLKPGKIKQLRGVFDPVYTYGKSDPSPPVSTPAKKAAAPSSSVTGQSTGAPAAQNNSKRATAAKGQQSRTRTGRRVSGLILGTIL